MMIGDTVRTPRQIVEELVRRQGRTYWWLASRAGMDRKLFHNTLAERYGYNWRPGEQQAVADALGVPVHYIWPGLIDTDPPGVRTKRKRPRRKTVGVAEGEAGAVVE